MATPTYAFSPPVLSMGALAEGNGGCVELPNGGEVLQGAPASRCQWVNPATLALGYDEKQQLGADSDGIVGS